MSIRKRAPPAIARGSQRLPDRDFGPTIRHRPDKAAAPSGETDPRRVRAAAIAIDHHRVVVKGYRPDPGNLAGGLIRGARVRDPLLKMAESGYISQRHWHAIEAFRDDVALADGATNNTGEDAGVRSAPSNRNWPSDTQLDAMRRVALTFAAYDPNGARLLAWTTLHNRSLRDFARDQHIRDERATKMLQDVLDILADRYTSRDTKP